VQENSKLQQMSLQTRQTKSINKLAIIDWQHGDGVVV